MIIHNNDDINKINEICNNDALIYANNEICSNEEALVDIGRNKNNVKAALHKVASNHFNRFLRFINSEYSSLKEIPEAKVEDKLLGLFSDYITKQCPSIKSYNTHDNYVSAIYVQLSELHPQRCLAFSKYYTMLRSNIFKQYQKLTVQKGLPMANSAKRMLVSELDYICKTLFIENKSELRALFCLDWVGVGRISEVCH